MRFAQQSSPRTLRNIRNDQDSLEHPLALIETSRQLGFTPTLASVKPQVPAAVAIDLEGGSAPNGLYIDEADWKFIRRREEVPAQAEEPEPSGA